MWLYVVSMLIECDIVEVELVVCEFVEKYLYVMVIVLCFVNGLGLGLWILMSWLFSLFVVFVVGM